MIVWKNPVFHAGFFLFILFFDRKQTLFMGVWYALYSGESSHEQSRKTERDPSLALRMTGEFRNPGVGAIHESPAKRLILRGY